MRINHNMNALNALYNLNINSARVASAMQKLSSGLRINSAADDAAGLSISEKMKAQIRGLHQGSRNAQDGISMLQTAEGALKSTQSMLQRMRELSVEASNDTYVTKDRTAIQSEMNQLKSEINRVSTDTEFNTQKLFDGTTSTVQFQVGANKNQIINFKFGKIDATTLGTTVYAKGDILPKGTIIGGTNIVTTVKNLPNAPHSPLSSTTSSKTTPVGNVVYIAKGTMVPQGMEITYPNPDKTDSKNTILTLKAGDKVNQNIALNETSIKITAGSTSDKIFKLSNNANSDGTFGVVAFNKGKLPDGFFIGATESNGKPLEKSVVAGSPVQGIKVDNSEDAEDAITTLDTAINTVSTVRANLGAVQNRLTYAINNDDNAAMNLTAAESRITDVNMAQEMVEFTKDNILQQAAQAMLGQANQQPQSILQLLR